MLAIFPLLGEYLRTLCNEPPICVALDSPTAEALTISFNNAISRSLSVFITVRLTGRESTPAIVVTPDVYVLGCSING